jgi:hypothetical protein
MFFSLETYFSDKNKKRFEYFSSSDSYSIFLLNIKLKYAGFLIERGGFSNVYITYEVGGVNNLFVINHLKVKSFSFLP